MEHCNPKPAVSVVVPVYKVEKYLRRCVDSILAQTLANIEIILVNDGSPDGCPGIIDAYAEQDSRVVVISQENKGYGSAVNRGFEAARGEYIGIVEADDWIEPTMYQKLYANAVANDPDVVKCSFYRHESKEGEYTIDTEWNHRHQNLHDAPDGVFSILDYPEMFNFHASVWAALYKTEFIKPQKMIETRAASYQDFPFMAETLCRARKITVVKECLVHYRMEPGQESSTQIRDERVLMMADQCVNAMEILKKYGHYDHLKEEFYYHSYLANYGFYNSVHYRHKREYFNKLRKLFLPLRDAPSFTFKYFTKTQRAFVRDILKNRYYSTIVPLRKIRKFLCSVHIKSKYVRVQLLGIAVKIGPHTYNAPCIAELSIMTWPRK